MNDKEIKSTKVYEFIKANIMNAVVFLTSFIFIFYNMVVIKRTELTVAEAIIKTGLSVIIGFIIKQALSENGFTKGYASSIWATNLDKYSHACNLANKYIDKVENFYAFEEIDKKKKYRRNNLMAVRLRYDDFFDDKGNFIDQEIKRLKSPKNSQIEGVRYLTKKQYKILQKCIKVKIYNLNLFSEYANEVENDTKKEKTDKDQRLGMMSKNSLATILSAIAGVYFTAMWNNWNWGAFISATLQVAIWIGCGITEMYKNYNYIVVEKVNKLTRKIELIIKFSRGCEKGLYTFNPYDSWKKYKEVLENETRQEVLVKDDTISPI